MRYREQRSSAEPSVGSNIGRLQPS